MSRHTPHRAFTLIELLTVIAIITLLIGILTPALTTARATATKAAVRAQINAMDVGLEAFRGEESEYPSSNAALYGSIPGDATEFQDWEVGTSAQPLQGAHLLVDALVGRDFLGYDPKAFPSPSPTGDPYDRWDPGNDRLQPFVPPDGVDTTSANEPPKDALGEIPVDNFGPPQPVIQGSGNAELLCRVFRDKFGWPILYYRARPTATPANPIINTTAGTISTDGVYDGRDNAAFTSYGGTSIGSCPTATNPHRICDADDPFPVQSPDYGTQLNSRFAEFIRSFRATTFDVTTPQLIVTPRPVKSDRFILLSAGRDGIYGNLDDVANFQVLSTER